MPVPMIMMIFAVGRSTHSPFNIDLGIFAASVSSHTESGNGNDINRVCPPVSWRIDIWLTRYEKCAVFEFEIVYIYRYSIYRWASSPHYMRMRPKMVCYMNRDDFDMTHRAYIPIIIRITFRWWQWRSIYLSAFDCIASSSSKDMSHVLRNISNGSLSEAIYLPLFFLLLLLLFG